LVAFATVLGPAKELDGGFFLSSSSVPSSASRIPRTMRLESAFARPHESAWGLAASRGRLLVLLQGRAGKLELEGLETNPTAGATSLAGTTLGRRFSRLHEHAHGPLRTDSGMARGSGGARAERVQMARWRHCFKLHRVPTHSPSSFPPRASACFAPFQALDSGAGHLGWPSGS
jgi:hypothetical protein